MNVPRFFMLAAALFWTCSAVTAQQPTSLKGKGIIYQITVWKYAVESVAAAQLKQSGMEDAPKQAVLKNYLTMKTKLDAAINQFVYELNRKHGLVRTVNQVNENFRAGTPNATYAKAAVQAFSDDINEFITDANSFCHAPAAKPSDVQSLDVAAFDPLAVISQVWTIFKDLKDLQSAKAEGLVTTLQAMRLSAPTALVPK